MRSRAARLMLSAMSWIVLGGAAFFIFQTERQIADRRAAVRAFDHRAREIERALADARAGQQAYVAAGQGVDFWTAKVAGLTSDALRSVDELRASAASAQARASLMEAAATVIETGNVDRRALDYLKAGQQLMAADVVFTEGGETSTLAAGQVEAARVAENQALDQFEGAARRRQAYAMGGAAAIAALMIALLGVGGLRSKETDASEVDRASPEAGKTELSRRTVPGLGAQGTMKAAAELCTELGRVKDSADLTTLLGRVADLMDASGLVVWIASVAGADLRPVLAHGYSERTLAKMTAVPRTADNAAAAAYRTGAMQIVLARPGTSSGALVAPLLTPEGCMGALTAEIKGGSETSDSIQALAAIFAAQLASLLASSATAGAPVNNVDDVASVDKIASA